MPNEENLRPFNERTESERRELARKGGIASGKKRRQAKAMAEVAEMVATAKVPNKSIKDMLKQCGIPAKEQNIQTAVVMSMAMKAIKGDARAARLYAEWLEQATQNNGQNNEIDILSAAFEGLEEEL